MSEGGSEHWEGGGGGGLTDGQTGRVRQEE